MKRIIDILLVLFCLTGAHSTWSQALVANIDMASCASYHSTMFLLSSEQVKVPKLIVFPGYRQADATNIENRFQFFEMGFHYVFNDELYYKTKDQAIPSTLTYLDENLDVVWKKDFREVQKNFVQNNIIPLSLSVEDNNIIHYYTKDYVYEFNHKRVQLNIYNRQVQLIRSIQYKELPFDSFAQILPEDIKDRLIDNNDPTYDYWTKDNQIYLEGIGSDNQIYISFDYLVFSENDKNDYDVKNAYAVLSPNSEEVAFFLDQPQKQYLINPLTGFLVGDEKHLISISYDYYASHQDIKSLAENKKAFFLSEYTLHNNTISYSKQIPYNLPKIYAEKYNKNYLTSFSSCYPILSLYLSNELYHLEKNKTALLIDDSLYQSKINYQTTELNTREEPIRVFTTVLTDQDMFCVAYSFDGGLYLNYYNMEMELIRKVDLNFVKDYLDARYINIDYYGDKITFSEVGKTPKVLTLPFKIF